MKPERFNDPVVAVYKLGVDRTLLRENLKLTFEQRALKHFRAQQMANELRVAGRKMRAGKKSNGN
jgi:hypothetical protein